MTPDAENTGHAETAAEMRRRLVTGSATRLKLTSGELLGEFGFGSHDAQSLVAIGAALSAAGLDCRPQVNAKLPADSVVTIRAERLQELPWREAERVAERERNALERERNAEAEAVPVSTTFEIPGTEIVEFHGEVFGLVVRSRNVVSNFGASAKAVVGGELQGLTKLLESARNDAMFRMRAEALRVGANAVIGMRYDSSEIGDLFNEVVAYGTAVTVRTKSAPPSSG